VIWLSLLEYVIKGLIFLYGHESVLAKVTKYTPLKPDPNPPLEQQNDPNLKDHFGGL
jgi:hypothetical protein